MSTYIDVATLGKVVLVSLVGGVGLVVLYAVAVRAASEAMDHHRAGGALVAATSLLVVVAGVAAGLWALLSA